MSDAPTTTPPPVVNPPPFAQQQWVFRNDGTRGEQDAGFLLGEAGYFVIDGPSGAGGHAANAPHPDGVAYSPLTGDMLIYDAKYFLSKARNAGSATGINENLDADYFDGLISSVGKMPDIPEKSEILSRLNACKTGLATKSWPANTRVAVVKTSGNVTGITSRLAAQNISYVDLNTDAIILRSKELKTTPSRPQMAQNFTYSARGQANGAGLMVMFMAADMLLNYFTAQQTNADVQKELNADIKAIKAWQKENPTDGCLIVITFKRTVPSDVIVEKAVLIHPGDQFEFSDMFYAERPEDAAKQASNQRSIIQGDVPNGPFVTVRRKQGVWIPPRVDPDHLPTYTSPIGSWKVKIGNWKGIFKFLADGRCSWIDAAGGAEHWGTWTVKNNMAFWTYSDDQVGWERLFQADLPLQYKTSGKATIKGVDHGFYEMTRIL